MNQDTEQYRAGFEAWAEDSGKFTDWSRYGDGYARPRVQDAWDAWTASKREASTEPSTKLDLSQLQRYYIGQAPAAIPLHNGAYVLFNDVETLVNRAAGALPDEARAKPFGWVTPQYDRIILASWYGPGVAPQVEGMLPVYVGQPDEAKDAARYRVLRMNAAPAEVAWSMGVECTRVRDDQAIEEMIDSLCDAAIQASTKAGSGQ